MGVDDPRDALSQLIFGHVPARAVQAAAELGLADLIADGIDTAAGLAGAVGADAGALRRLMRFLVSLGLFDQIGSVYTLTAMGDLLRSDVAGSQRPTARLSMNAYPAWVDILHTIRTGESAYRKYYCKPMF